VGAILAIGLALGVVSALGGGVRYGLMNEILPPGGYMLGRSVLNMSVGIMQIVGFAAGGVLVTVISPRETLLIGAVLYVVSGILSYAGLSRRALRAGRRPRRPGGTTSCCSPRRPAATSTSGCACRTG
jgi:MFS family permease